jgi:hypothetical protein
MFGKTCKVHALYLNGWINWPHPHHHVLVSYQLRNTNITSRFQHVFNSTSFTLLFFFLFFFAPYYMFTCLDTCFFFGEDPKIDNTI